MEKSVITFLSSSAVLMRKVRYKLEDIIQPPRSLPLVSERIEVQLPPGGDKVSVEMALNSRCTSDSDNNPRKFHWGMFDRTKRLSAEQVNKIVGLAHVPGFTGQRVEICINQNILTFVIDNHIPDTLREYVMIESGMQQQAIGLICAALGAGMVFRNLGKDGTAISDTEYANVNIEIDAMALSYSTSYWTGSRPGGFNPWLRGNLPEPARDSGKSLISIIPTLKMENKSLNLITKELISQLLWAARGRTPHFYKSRPWGLTIPTWGGEQNISSLYLISDKRVYKYINWEKSRPTHSLSELKSADESLLKEMNERFPSKNKFIVIGKNEQFNRALWEAGYQLLNILLQAKALNISYEACLLNEDQRRALSDIGINDPVVMIGL